MRNVHREQPDSPAEDAPEGVNAQFGDLMKTAREARGWSQRQLAELLAAVDLKLDPSAITRIERGSRDVKLSEAIAIAGVLEFRLDELSFSPAKDFLMREYSQVEMTIRARRAILQAIRQIDRWVNNTDESTEQQFMERRDLSAVWELYTYQVRQAPAFRYGGKLNPTDGDNFALYFNEQDFRVKQTLIEQVVSGVLVSEAEFERIADEHRRQLGRGLKNLIPPEAEDK